MALATQALYDMAKREVGGGVGGTIFDNAFVNAVNFATSELADECNLTPRPGIIASVGDSITGMDTDRQYIVYSGVIYYLMRMGQRPTDPKVASVMYVDTDKQWNNGKANYWTKALNDCQANPHSSITKLGSVDT